MAHELVRHSTAYHCPTDTTLHRFEVRTAKSQWSVTVNPLDYANPLHMEAAAYELLFSKLIDDKVDLSKLVKID